MFRFNMCLKTRLLCSLTITKITWICENFIFWFWCLIFFVFRFLDLCSSYQSPPLHRLRLDQRNCLRQLSYAIKNQVGHPKNLRVLSCPKLVLYGISEPGLIGARPMRDEPHWSSTNESSALLELDQW